MFDFFGDVIAWLSSISHLIGSFISGLGSILSLASAVVSWVLGAVVACPSWITTLILFFLALLLLFFVLGR